MGIEQGSGKTGDPSPRERLDNKLAKLRTADIEKAQRVREAREKYINTAPSVETAKATDELLDATVDAKEQIFDSKWFEKVSKHPASTEEFVADVLEEAPAIQEISKVPADKVDQTSLPSLEKIMSSGDVVEEVNARIDEFNILRDTKHAQFDEAVRDFLTFEPSKEMEAAAFRMIQVAVDTGKIEADRDWIEALGDHKYVSEPTRTEVWDSKNRRNTPSTETTEPES